jgi:leucine dehydrogenase
MNVLDLPEFDGHEAVHVFHEPAAGLDMIVAVHNTARGPAVGGCRMWPYASGEAALADALRLAKGMTYKAALAQLPCGGGKSVVVGNPQTTKTRELLAAVGRAVDSLGGRYTISDDVGITATDVAVIGEQTKFACAPLMADGNASPATAFGTYQGILATAAYVFGTDQLEGRTIAVQGLGAVGAKLCEYLAEAGAQLWVSDLDVARTEVIARRLSATPVAVEELLHSTVDIVAPCAMGGVFNDSSILQLQCRAIAGAANNQLANAQAGAALAARGIVYAPDYAINVGGLIDLVHAQRGDYRVAAVLRECRRIFATTLDILERAAASGEPTSDVADRLAEQRFREASALNRVRKEGAW